jgi:hypothetical protein
LEEVDEIARLGARGMALRPVPGQHSYSTTQTAGNKDIVIAVDRNAPRRINSTGTGEALWV